MRISDWRSDVCSSDLMVGKSFDFLMDRDGDPITPTMIYKRALSPDDWTRRGLDSSILHRQAFRRGLLTGETANPIMRALASDRTSVVSGKSVSVRVAIGGRRIIKNKKTYTK